MNNKFVIQNLKLEKVGIQLWSSDREQWTELPFLSHIVITSKTLINDNKQHAQFQEYISQQSAFHG